MHKEDLLTVSSKTDVRLQLIALGTDQGHARHDPPRIETPCAEIGGLPLRGMLLHHRNNY
jgi:hypothetical protein